MIDRRSLIDIKCYREDDHYRFVPEFIPEYRLIECPPDIEDVVREQIVEGILKHNQL